MITSVAFMVTKFVSNLSQNVEGVTWTGSRLTIGSFCTWHRVMVKKARVYCALPKLRLSEKKRKFIMLNFNTFEWSDPKARFKRRAIVVSNLMQISRNNSFFSFTLGSTRR